MKKTVLVLVFIFIYSSSYFPQQNNFPLDVGNKWYYQTTSNYPGYYYGVIKEITDTLPNGFRKLQSKYLYLDRYEIQIEYWAYIDGKFYLNSIPQVNDYPIYYAYLSQDSCIGPPMSNYCWIKIPNYSIIGISGAAQECHHSSGGASGGNSKGIITMPGLGMVWQRDFQSLTLVGISIIDTSNLIGCYIGGELLGDTLFNLPQVATANFPLQIGQAWVYKHILQNDNNNFDETVVRKIITEVSPNYWELEVTFNYQDSIITKNEYWLFENQKLFISNPFVNSVPFYDANLRGYKFYSYRWLKWTSYAYNNVTYEAQSFGDQFYTLFIIANNIGLVQTRLNGNTQILIDMYFTHTIPEINSISEFNLYQNFPNPFNPATKISFQIPSAGNITLKVFDVLGNEVATLVDEFKTAGSYEVEFNPSSIKHHPSSGIYFYRLQAGDYVETKKMILMK